MKYVFSSKGLEQLASLRSEPSLFAFDFDGTLSPIVRQSHKALLPSITRNLLEELSEEAPVAVISGRALRDLRKLVPVKLRGWAGDHGAEIIPHSLDRKAELKKAKVLVRHWSKTLNPMLRELPGVWLEIKALSLCVHFRESPHRAAARAAILKAVASLDPGPRALPGKCVVNLLNPMLPHKGDAVLALMSSLGLERALYVGDDSNDEDVFALADPRISTIRVGKLDDSKASLYLRRQSEINRLIRFLLSRYR
jgi:trehalose 6-phosphate phosphatase